MSWNFACPDWVERLKSGRSLVPDLPLNTAEADRAVAIFNKLRLPDVPGQPPMSEAAGDWFRDIVRAAFGSIEMQVNAAKGTEEEVRRVAEIFALVPKKNSKTTGGAAIMVTAMLLNKRPNAELLFVGPTQDISDLAFQQASGMIEADPDGYLSKRFHIREHIKAIEDRRNGATMKVKTFDMRVMTGVKPVVVLVDELHIMASFSYASRVIGQIRGGLLPNPESLLIFITTQSDQPPAGAFKAELQYARGVRDGRIVSREKAPVRMLPILYEFPEVMQTAKDKPWRDPANWPMVTPNLGRSITVERLEADYAQACEKGDEEERRWASQHLNVEIGLALHANRWRGADYWQDAADASLTLDELLDRSEVVTIGIDGGGLDDLLGLAVVGRCKRTRDWLLWAHAWCDEGVLERRKDIAERLRDYERDGDLTICADVRSDLMQVAETVKRVYELGLLPEKDGVGLDKAGLLTIVDEIVAAGVPEDVLCSVPQGFNLQPAILGLERKLKNGTLWHSGTPLMAWCVGNAKAELKGNTIYITKEAASGKIDPLVASFDAAILMGRNPQPSVQLITVSDDYEIPVF